MNEQPPLSEEWNDAQAHELEFWRGRADARKASNSDPDNCRWWNQFWDVLDQNVVIGKSAIEIGAGPTPMLVCAPESVIRRIAIEPLAEKFRESGWKLSESIQWVAEPLETATIGEPVDLVICVNVLDHMDDPQLSLSKMRYALNDPGYLFLWVHTQQAWYNLVYDRLPFKSHDHMHPHRFTRRSLVSSLGVAGFSDIRLIDWKASRDPSKTKTLKQRIIQKIAVSETLVVAKT
ncbi:MAG: methyltransferase domain-containing protein [Chloroflexi bacterium]|nr:methyltransferase domain-containing protein [Chloroflexota bacterium]